MFASNIFQSRKMAILQLQNHIRHIFVNSIFNNHSINYTISCSPMKVNSLRARIQPFQLQKDRIYSTGSLTGKRKLKKTPWLFTQIPFLTPKKNDAAKWALPLFTIWACAKSGHTIKIIINYIQMKSCGKL